MACGHGGRDGAVEVEMHICLCVWRNGCVWREMGLCDKLEEGPVFKTIPDLLTAKLCDLGQ